MGGLSIWHWMIVLLVVMVLFGSGKVSSLMGDVAKGIKTFKKTMAEEDATMDQPAPPAGSLGAPEAGIGRATDPSNARRG